MLAGSNYLHDHLLSAEESVGDELARSDRDWLVCHDCDSIFDFISIVAIKWRLDG